MDEQKYTRLMSYLTQLPDPRHARGKRYPWPMLLGIVAAGLAAGMRGPLAIAEWAWEHRAVLSERLGQEVGRVPSESTIQRVLRSVGLPQLERLLGEHNLAVAKQVGSPTAGLWALALDGKWLRTASAHGAPVVLLSLCTHQWGLALRQRRVPRGTNEEGAAPGLLAGLDLSGCLVTMDAGLTSKALMAQILAQGGEYLMVVKQDTPGLYAAIEGLFAVPPDDRYDAGRQVVVDWHKGHGRLEMRRTACSDALADWLDDWPRPSVVLQRTTQRTRLKTGVRGDVEVSYAICSVPLERADASAYEAWWRGHWSIENRVHYPRDVTFGEDRCAVWRGRAPQVLAALRNALLATIRAEQRWEYLPSALRWAAANPIHALQLIGAVSTMT